MSTFERYFKDTLVNRYADFNGRARRSEYWYFVLYYMLILFGLYAIIGIGAVMDSGVLSAIGGGLVMILALGMIIPSLAVAVRRLHDTGKSGWMYLIAFIPIVGSIALIIFFCTDSTPGSNKWGPNPKEIDEDSDVADHLID